MAKQDLSKLKKEDLVKKLGNKLSKDQIVALLQSQPSKDAELSWSGAAPEVPNVDSSGTPVPQAANQGPVDPGGHTGIPTGGSTDGLGGGAAVPGRTPGGEWRANAGTGTGISGLVGGSIGAGRGLARSGADNI